MDLDNAVAMTSEISKDDCSEHQKEINDQLFKIQSQATEMFKQKQDIDDLKENLKEKDASIRSFAKVNLDLRRKLQEIGEYFNFNKSMYTLLFSLKSYCKSFPLTTIS